MPLSKMKDNSSKYISLKSAAELYGYTRDHLGLMIRRGRLKGAKLGNYYVTTGDWMVEYVKNFSDINHPISKNKLSNKFLTDIITAENKTKTRFDSEKNRNRNINDNDGKNRALTLLQVGLKTDFEKQISEELSKLQPSFEKTSRKTNVYAGSYGENSDFKNYGLKTNNEYPYVVLPIREMGSGERENILNKIGKRKDKEYSA